MPDIDFTAVAQIFGSLFLFWFGSSGPWWAAQIYRQVTYMSPPEERE